MTDLQRLKLMGESMLRMDDGFGVLRLTPPDRRNAGQRAGLIGPGSPGDRSNTPTSTPRPVRGRPTQGGTQGRPRRPRR